MDHIHTHYALTWLKYLVFVFVKFWKNSFYFEPIFYSYKNSPIFYNMPWFCASMFVYQSILVKLFLWIFYVFMGFYLSQIDKLFKSQKTVFRLQLVDLLPYSRLTLKSVDRIGRPTCTDVHAFVHWRDGRPTRSTARELLLSGNPGRPYRSTNREFCSLFQFSVDRAVDRRLQRSDFWPLAVDRPGRPVGLTDPNGYIFSAYKFGGLVIIFEKDF